MRILFYFFGISCILIFCSPKREREKESSLLYYDDTGREVKLNHIPKRILSLAPSMTEMLFAIADTQTIIGVTKNCNFPPDIKNKKKVSVYPLDLENILLLKPDIIFTKDGMIAMDNIQKYTNVTDILDGLVRIGKIINQDKKATYLVDSLKKELAKIKVKNSSARKKTVLGITIPIYDPIYAYGYYSLFTDKLHILGLENAIDSTIKNSFPALSREYILKINPDIIIGESFHEMDSSFFKMYPELKAIKAYQTKQIYRLNDDLQSRPTPRVIESIIELKNAIYNKK